MKCRMWKVLWYYRKCPPVVRNFFIFQDNCPLTVIADADLHHIMKMQVINLITVVLYPFFAQKRQHRTFFRHFIKAVLHFHLFLAAHTATPLEIVTPSYHVLFFPTSKPATHLFPSYAWKQKNCRKSFSFKISFDSFLSSDRIFYHASFF